MSSRLRIGGFYLSRGRERATPERWLARLWVAVLLGFAMAAANAQEAEPHTDDSGQTRQGGAPQEPVPQAPEDPEQVETIPVDPRQPGPEEPLPPPARQRDEFDTIVVTATKRVVDLRDIAGSVGAVSGEDLEKMNAQSMKDYLKLIPGVILPDQGSDESVPIIRGVATSTSGVGPFTAPTTGIFLDDMPFTTLLLPLSFPDLNPFDMERVEVLKGPQGTLFGGTALNGAIRYITRKAEHGAWEAKIRQTMSDTRFGGGIAPVTAGAVNIPLFGDTLALRAVGVRRRDRGLYDSFAEDNSGNELRNAPNADRLTQDTGRVLASWNPPVEGLQVSAFYFIQDSFRADTSLADNPDRPTIGPDDIGRPFASPRTHLFTGSNLRVNYDFGWAELLSTTTRFTQDNWINAHGESAFSLDRQNENEFFNVISNSLKGISTELRLSSPQGGAGNWDWVAGFTFFRNNEDFWQLAHLGPDIEDPKRKDQVTEEQKATTFLFADVFNLGNEKALFGDVTWRPGKHWELNAGVRVFRINLDYFLLVCGQQVLALAPPEDRSADNPGCVENLDSLTETGFNPKVSVRWLPNRNVQMYALVAKGFQFGGFQVNPPFAGFQESAEQSGNQFSEFESSVLWNFEAGIRTEWLDRRLRFDLTGFRLNWTDLQLTVAVPFGGAAGRIPRPGLPPEQIPPDLEEEDTTSVNFGSIENVGRAHSTGMELSLAVIPFTGAQWITNVAWIKAVTAVPFDEDNAAGPVPAGTTLPGSPRWQVSNVASYQRSLPFFSQWNIGAALTHSRFSTAPNSIRPSGRGTILGFETFDARLALTRPESRFQPEVSFGVNNLTDVRGFTGHGAGSRLDDGRPVQSFVFIRPRTMTLSLSMQF